MSAQAQREPELPASERLRKLADQAELTVRGEPLP